MGAGLPATGAVQDRMGRPWFVEVLDIRQDAAFESGGKAIADTVRKGTSKQHSRQRSPTAIRPSKGHGFESCLYRAGAENKV
jgi:hypothetical protein